MKAGNGTVTGDIAPLEIADLGDALATVPTGRGGSRALLREVVEASGGYVALAAEVAAHDTDLV